MLDLPTALTVGHVSPFLDRFSWNNLSLSSTEFQDDMQSLSPPWPTYLKLLQRQQTSSLICNFTMSADAKFIVCAGEDGRISFYESRTGHHYTTPSSASHSGIITAMRFSPSNTNKLLTASRYELFLWDLLDGTRAPTHRHIGQQDGSVDGTSDRFQLVGMDFSTNGELIVCQYLREGNQDGTVSSTSTTTSTKYKYSFATWTIDDGVCLHHWTMDRNDYDSISFLPSTKHCTHQVASYVEKLGTIQVWDVGGWPKDEVRSSSGGSLMKNMNQVHRTVLIPPEPAPPPTKQVILQQVKGCRSVYVDSAAVAATSTKYYIGLQFRRTIPHPTFTVRLWSLVDGSLRSKWNSPEDFEHYSMIPVENLASVDVTLIGIYYENTHKAAVWDVNRNICIATVSNVDRGFIRVLVLLPCGRTFASLTNFGHLRFHKHIQMDK